MDHEGAIEDGAGRGGSLQVETTLGQGSTFSFDFRALPAPVAEEEPPPVRSVQASEERSARRILNVLLVEDYKVNQRLTVAMLSKAGHQVSVANDGAEALERLTERTFDVVLMDLQMPGLDGFDTTRRIRKCEAKEGAHVPIIAVTANAMVGDRERCLAAGMDDYLTKPFSRSELIRIVERSVVGSSRALTVQ